MPRPPKGTPTGTNIFALASLFGGETRVPNRMHATTAPHIRRCLRAPVPLVAVEGPDLVLTPAGADAVKAHRADFKRRTGRDLPRSL